MLPRKLLYVGLVCFPGRCGGLCGRREGVGACSFDACLSYMTTDHASLARQGKGGGGGMLAAKPFCVSGAGFYYSEYYY